MSEDNTNKNYDRSYSTLKNLGKAALAVGFGFLLFKAYQKNAETNEPIEGKGFPKNYTVENTLLPINGKPIYVEKIPGEKYDSVMVDPKTQKVRYSGHFGFRIKGDNNHKLRDGNGDVWGTFSNDSIDKKLEK